MIRVDYLVRVISLLFLIGVLTSCVPEEDAVESSSGSNSISLGDVKILWGTSNSRNVTFSEAFKEVPNIQLTGLDNTCSASFLMISTPDNGSLAGFTMPYDCHGSFHWQAIGR